MCALPEKQVGGKHEFQGSEPPNRDRLRTGGKQAGNRVGENTEDTKNNLVPSEGPRVYKGAHLSGLEQKSYLEMGYGMVFEQFPSKIRLRMQRLMLVLGLISAAALTSPSRAQDRDDDQPRHKADLSRLVVVGDSLSAGFQNDSLLDLQQPHGYASLVAAQARVPLWLPLIA